jgi:hypothetical protein
LLPKATLEKFAEISQAEEEQRGGMLLLDGGILPHQRSGGSVIGASMDYRASATPEK